MCADDWTIAGRRPNMWGMAFFEQHVFVCGGCPGPDIMAPSMVSETFSYLFQMHGLLGRVGLNKCNCLGLCPEGGAAVVVYPDNVWYGPVTEEDVEEIVTSHLVDGNPVERLRRHPEPADG
jgi:(2Fe-2S) ferredoxin